MKNTFLFLAAALSVSVSIETAKAGEFLTPNQKQAILRSVDNTCGDTWCEGDYNYAFKSIDCDSSAEACTLQFVMLEEQGRSVKLKAVSRAAKYTARISNAHSVACTVKNLGKAEDLITFVRPDYSVLTNRFYEPLTDCISTLEKKLAR